jgi:glucosamine-6-phosphate deaminase
MDAAPRDYAGMKTLVNPDAERASRAAADLLIGAADRARAIRGRAVLGLATGTTPERVYSLLVERHRLGSLSFRDVSTHNLDEYSPISPLDPKSYRA